MKIKKVCGKCGSHSLNWDAMVEWSESEQRFETCFIESLAECNDCNETKVDISDIKIYTDDDISDLRTDVELLQLPRVIYFDYVSTADRIVTLLSQIHIRGHIDVENKRITT